jgi:hypothetical protein
MSRLISRLDKIRAHACRWAMLPLTSVPSAAIDDEQIALWSSEMYERDLDADKPTRTGEVA